MNESSLSIDIRLPSDWADDEMRADMTRAFTGSPIVLPPKWLYDHRGSEIFSEITRLKEYYPTEAERSLLKRHADEIASVTGADTIVELGSGTSDKTRTLLDSFAATNQLTKFAPVDVSEETLREAAAILDKRYPGIEIAGLVGDFTRHLPHLPTGDKRLVAFLGGTIGNFYVEERRAFLGALADVLHDGEWLLLGFDPLKSVDKILDAYNDEPGVTAKFVRNVLSVINNKLGADFDLSEFEYIPFWDGTENRVDMRLRSSVPQQIRIESLDLHVDLGEGEEIRVEISTKFSPSYLSEEIKQAGFNVHSVFLSENDEFGLLLAERSPAAQTS